MKRLTYLYTSSCDYALITYRCRWHNKGTQLEIDWSESWHYRGNHWDLVGYLSSNGLVKWSTLIAGGSSDGAAVMICVRKGVMTCLKEIVPCFVSDIHANPLKTGGYMMRLEDILSENEIRAESLSYSCLPVPGWSHCKHWESLSPGPHTNPWLMMVCIPWYHKWKTG